MKEWLLGWVLEDERCGRVDWRSGKRDWGVLVNGGSREVGGAIYTVLRLEVLVGLGYVAQRLGIRKEFKSLGGWMRFQVRKWGVDSGVWL